MPYICASTAKQTYRLSERDLEEIYCRYVRNPHYSSAAPMRLYDEDDVREIAEEKAERLQYERDHADEIRSEKTEERKKLARELDTECKSRISSWNVSDRVHERYDTSLPVDVWSAVMMKLCDDIEIDGVRGVSVVARDICNACLSCSDMKAASPLAFARLAFHCPNLPEIGEKPGTWDEFLSKPASMKVDVLKAMTRELGLMTGGTKAVLICRLLAHFGVSQPSEVPVKILNEILSERCSYHRNLDIWYVAIGSKSSRFESNFRVREICVRNGYPTLEALRARHEQVIEERRSREAAERENAAQTRARTLLETSSRVDTNQCTCTCSAATKCPFQKCAKCCPGPCPRHRK